MTTHIFRFFITAALLITALTAFAQDETEAIGQSLTDLKISVERAGYEQALPLREVPRLEKNDKLVIEFEKNPTDTVDISRQPYRRLVVFFIDPRAVINDIKSNPNAVQERRFYYRRRWQRKFTLTVPYTSFPLIFLNSGGSYKRTLKKLVLSNEANIQSLAENSVVIAEYPRMINFLINARDVLKTRPAENSKVLQSIIENSRLFKLDKTNCFKGEFLRKKNSEKISCLINNLNVRNFKDDLGKISWDKITTQLAKEAVGQLRNKYQGLNIYLDVAVLIFRIIADLYSKKPLTVELASLIPVQNESGEMLRLFKTPLNTPPGHNKALILIPMEWRDNDEILTDDQIASVEVEPIRSCFSEGENIFRIVTEHTEIKREIREFRLTFRKSHPPSGIVTREGMRLNLARDQFAVNVRRDEWRRVGEGRITGILNFKYNFKKYEKKFEMLSLPAAKWELIPSGTPIRKGDVANRILISPNTARRDCIEKVVLSDSSETKTSLTKTKSALRFNGNSVEIPLSNREKEKFQAGDIFIHIFEPLSNRPVNRNPLTFRLLDRKPLITAFTIRRGERIGLVRGERLDDIKTLLVNNSKVTSFDPKTGEVVLIKPITGPTASLKAELGAGDSVASSFSVIPTADVLNGSLDCSSKDNSSSVASDIKVAYRPYAFSDCLIPIDTDVLNLVLISRASYEFRSAEKPLLILEVETKPGRYTKLENLEAIGEVKNKRRMDVKIPIKQNLKNWLTDQKKLFLRFLDKEFGESTRYEFKVNFAQLPKRLSLDCRLEKGKKCELSGDIGVIEQVSVGKENENKKWFSVGFGDTKVILPKLDYEGFFWIKLRSHAKDFKVNLKNLGNTSVSYHPAPPEQIDVSNR